MIMTFSFCCFKGPGVCLVVSWLLAFVTTEWKQLFFLDDDWAALGRGTTGAVYLSCDGRMGADERTNFGKDTQAAGLWTACAVMMMMTLGLPFGLGWTGWERRRCIYMFFCHSFFFGFLGIGYNVLGILSGLA